MLPHRNITFADDVARLSHIVGGWGWGGGGNGTFSSGDGETLWPVPDPCVSLDLGNRDGLTHLQMH